MMRGPIAQTTNAESKQHRSMIMRDVKTSPMPKWGMVGSMNRNRKHSIVWLLLALIVCSCKRYDPDSGEFDGMLPEIGNVRLGMSPRELASARPGVTQDSYAYDERLESGGTATYLFQDDLPDSVGIRKKGILAIVIDYTVPASDTAAWAHTMEKMQAHWARIVHSTAAVDLERRVPKYVGSPPIRTRVQYWQAPEANIALYAELEPPQNSSRQVRLIRVIIQDRALDPATLLPDTYQDVLR